MTDPANATPLVVSRFDVAMESAPEEEPVLTIGAIAEDGRPVALRFDAEDRRKVAAWLAPERVDANAQGLDEVGVLLMAALSGNRNVYLAARDAVTRRAKGGGS